MKKLLLLPAILLSSFANAGVPAFNASCPDNVNVQAAQDGPVYINSNEARLKEFTETYFEAKDSGVIISISINPDQSLSITYTGKNGENGVCQLNNGKPTKNPSTKEKIKDAILSIFAPADLVENCRNEAAGQLGIKSAYITTENQQRTADGGYSVKGTADLGYDGKKSFQCEYNSRGGFVRFKEFEAEDINASEIIAPRNMGAFCQNEAALQFDIKPAYIATEKLQRTNDGRYVVKGTANLGRIEGEIPFQCEFNRRGQFIEFNELDEEEISSDIIAPKNMVAYCRGEAAKQFDTKPAYIETEKLERTRRGGYIVKGTADLGYEGKKAFQCNFDREGRFRYFRSLEDEGAL